LHEFKGYGWQELAEAWGIPYDDDDARYVESVRDYVVRCISDDKPYAELRKFVTAIHAQSEKIDYFYPVWKGLLAVQDRSTFVQCVMLLLPTMWT
jgi:uncharacterized protein YbaA (DUF1428 family)